MNIRRGSPEGTRTAAVGVIANPAPSLKRAETGRGTSAGEGAGASAGLGL